MTRTEIALQPDRSAYPVTTIVREVDLIITGTATRPLVRIGAVAMMDKLAMASGSIRGQPVAWAWMRIEAVSLLVVWPRPDESYVVRVMTATEPG